MAYSEDGFKFHEIFGEEFRQLLQDASGHEKEIFALLVKQLIFIKNLGKQVNRADGNEIIKYMERDYYSLHLTGKNFNLRLFMTFSEKGIPMFLGAMYEREGKRVSDYTGWAEKLEKRYNDLAEEMNDD